MPLPTAPVVLPLWRGRRGVVNTVVCGALGLLCGVLLAWMVDRTVVAPACVAYGSRHAMTYVDFKVYGSHRHDSGACMFKGRGAQTQDIGFREASSFMTDLAVGLVFSLELTVPAFILLFALARTGLYFVSR